MLKVEIQGILFHMLSNWMNYIRESSEQYRVTSCRDDEILIR